jgi:alpha-L-rhamnosidase
LRERNKFPPFKKMEKVKIKYYLKNRIFQSIQRAAIIIVMTIVPCAFVFSSETIIRDGVKGIWFGPNEHDIGFHRLNASWIWADEKLDAKAILTRRTFTLGNGFEGVLLRITASSQYQLYVNGEYVCRGPARCAPHHQSYDILDITEMLKVGENLIAVRVHHQDGKHSYQYKGRSGLQAQISFEQGNVMGFIFSDTNWKVIPDPSWDNNAPKISRFQQVVNDRVDFRKYLKGWTTLDFNDSNWSDATELMRKNGWPAPQKNAKAQSLIPPWTSLVARDIPYLIERDLTAEKLIEAVQIKASIVEKTHTLSEEIRIKQNNEKPLEIPASSDSKSWLLIYDFGEVINGMPKLDIQGKEGTEVEIVTAPFMVDKQFTHKTVDSEFRDKIILSGERDKWEATYFKPTRYLGIIVKNKETLKLFSAGIHQIKYPFERRGHMSSTDAPWIKDYFEASAKTINVCTTDAYTDNYRERRQYAQTNYYAALGNYYVFGDLALQRRYLIQVAQEQLANGIMPAYAPAATDDFMIILDSNCLWIRGLHNYYMYSGDEKTVRELLPAAKKLMDLLHSFTYDLYFIDNPPYAYWLDHSINDRRGTNLCLNGHYFGALKDYAEILGFLNIDNTEVEYQKEAAHLSFGHFWNEEKQLFADAIIDGKRSQMFSEHGNAMALAMKGARIKEAEQVAKQLLADDKHDYMKRESGITMVTPAMSYFLHKGLCEYGFVDESFELFRRRFDKMLDENTNQTLWEEWWLDGTGRTGKFQGGRTRSDAQTESAFPPALFAEYLIGIQITKPGMKEILIKKTQASLKNIESIIPTPEGDLHVKWNFSGGELELVIPAEMVVKLDLESLDISDTTGVKLDGKVLDSKSVSQQFVSLLKGKHKIEF